VIRLIERRLDDGFFILAPENVERPRTLTVAEDEAFNVKQRDLQQRAEALHDVGCWHFGCSAAATVWVREVSFDFKGPEAAPERHAAVSSADYPGPVPGFCVGHLHDGPAMLAEAVYFDRPEMAWGVRPTRWWVSFTDGTRQGGDIRRIDPKQATPVLEVA
jgi:hypothetical protein